MKKLVYVLPVLCGVLLSVALSFAGMAGGSFLNDGVTANSTSPAFTVQGTFKTFYAEVVGTGAVTATVALYGDVDMDSSNGILLCTITLSGTTRVQDACAPMTANFTSFYAVISNVTGAGAKVKAYAMY